MEVKNNTPICSSQSFGMAFRTPLGKDKERFAEYLLKSGMSGSEARDAILELRNKHMRDKHFDFRYFSDLSTGKDGFVIVPRSVMAEIMYGKGDIIFSPSIVDGFDRTAKCAQRCKKRLEGAKGLRLVWAKIANFFDRRSLASDVKRDPSIALPAELRAFSAQVKMAESKVEKRLAYDAEKEKIIAAFKER